MIDKLAYRTLAKEGIDECGLTTLAGRTVGASFVGTVTAAVVISELIRMGLGGHRYEVADGSLRSLEGCLPMERRSTPGRRLQDLRLFDHQATDRATVIWYSPEAMGEKRLWIT